MSGAETNASSSPDRTGGSRPDPVERLIDEFTKLPGIGRRSAERMAFHILKAKPEEALRLSQVIADVKECGLRECCFGWIIYSPGETCYLDVDQEVFHGCSNHEG